MTVDDAFLVLCAPLTRFHGSQLVRQHAALAQSARALRSQQLELLPRVWCFILMALSSGHGIRLFINLLARVADALQRRALVAQLGVVEQVPERGRAAYAGATQRWRRRQAQQRLQRVRPVVSNRSTAMRTRVRPR
jgi:hypothetical protein